MNRSLLSVGAMRTFSVVTAVALVLFAVGLASSASADTGGPTVVLTSSCTSATSTAPIMVTATFSENVNAFGTSSVAVGNGSASNFGTSSADTVFTFDVTPSAQGTVTVQVPDNAASSTASSTGNVASNVVSCSYANAAPIISGISVSGIGTSSATVNFTTNTAAQAFLSYGTTTSYGATTTTEASATTTHSLPLLGLSDGTTYHLQITASNVGGTATSSDQTFLTLSTGSSTPLHVDSVTADKTSAIADNVYADGWQWTMHLTVPDTENAFRIRFSDWAQGSSTFAAGGNMRVYSAQSSNANSTSNALNITDNGYDGWVYLTGDTASSTAGRQVDLVIQVKIPFGTNPGSYTTFFTAQSWPSLATSTAPTI